MRQKIVAVGGIAVAIGLVTLGTAAAAPSKPAPAAPSKPAATAPTVTLTWRFEMSAPDDTIEQHVSLLVTTNAAGQGNVTKTYKLDRMMGFVDPINQPLCRGAEAQYPLEKNEVAKITFYEGGARGYYVKRSKGGTTLQLYSFATTDGLCEPQDGCHQPKDRYVRKIAIPANAKIVEQMEERLAGATAFTPFNCNPSHEP